MRALVRPWRAGVLVAVPALAVLGLAGMPSVAGAATDQPPPVPTGAAVRPAASAQVAPHFLSPLAAAPLPAGIERGCATPAQAGQMQCDVLVNTHARPGTAVKPDTIPANAGWTPAQLESAYDLTVVPPPLTPPTVAIVDAYNDPNAASDLAQYRSDGGLAPCTVAGGCLKIVNQTGGATLPGADPAGGWEVEESLDLDMVSAICPGCQILLVEANSPNITDLAIAENYAAGQAKFVSNSWGSGGEFIGENSFDNAFNHPGCGDHGRVGRFRVRHAVPGRITAGDLGRRHHPQRGVVAPAQPGVDRDGLVRDRIWVLDAGAQAILADRHRCGDRLP
jgi:hypothetical protein